MFLIALKMLVGDRAKYIGILVGLTFASLLMTQQASIFIGLMTRTYGYITDTPLPDLWVMKPESDNLDQYQPMPEVDLFRVRSVEGVGWAVPLFRGIVDVDLPEGSSWTVKLVGADDATLIGGPPKMIVGSLQDLRQDDAVILEINESADKLTKKINGRKVPLDVGDTFEINDRRAVVVGLADSSRNFTVPPQVYTTYNRAKEFIPPERNFLSYVLVGKQEGVDVATVAKNIEKATGLKALTPSQFKWLNVWYYIKNTGIAINFGVAVALGFLAGMVIAGQMFFNFVTDNLLYFATLKAMGASNWLLARMVMLQALLAAVIGYGLGVGLAALFGLLSRGVGVIAFYMPYQLLIFVLMAVIAISMAAALVSIRRLFQLQPSLTFRS